MRSAAPLALFLLVAACGDASDEPRAEQLGRTSATLEVTTPASELGIDDLVFRRVDSQPLLTCPPDAPFVCRSENAAGWTCSELACAPSCEKIGCPGAYVCIDCGGGAECAPADHDCGR